MEKTELDDKDDIVTGRRAPVPLDSGEDNEDDAAVLLVSDAETGARVSNEVSENIVIGGTAVELDDVEESQREIEADEFVREERCADIDAEADDEDEAKPATTCLTAVSIRLSCEACSQTELPSKSLSESMVEALERWVDKIESDVSETDRFTPNVLTFESDDNGKPGTIRAVVEV